MKRRQNSRTLILLTVRRAPSFDVRGKTVELRFDVAKVYSITDSATDKTCLIVNNDYR